MAMWQINSGIVDSGTVYQYKENGYAHWIRTVSSWWQSLELGHSPICECAAVEVVAEETIASDQLRVLVKKVSRRLKLIEPA